MKRIDYFLLAGLLLAAAFSCDKKPVETDVPDVEVEAVVGVPMTMKVTIGGPDTKLSYTKNGNVLKGVWDANEKVSVVTIFGDSIQTVDEFSSGTASEGQRSAVFAGTFTGDASNQILVIYPALEDYIMTGISDEQYWGTPMPAAGYNYNHRMISEIRKNANDGYNLNMGFSTQSANGNTDHLGAYTFMTGEGTMSEGALDVTLEPKISVLQVNITFSEGMVGKAFSSLAMYFKNSHYGSDSRMFGEGEYNLLGKIGSMNNAAFQYYGSWSGGTQMPITLSSDNLNFVSYIPFVPGDRALIGSEGANLIEFRPNLDGDVDSFMKTVNLSVDSELESGKIYRVNVTIDKKDQTLSFANDYEEAVLGSSYSMQTVSGARTDVEYTSSNTDVATISGTTITLVGLGETTITATAAEDDYYNSATASYTLKVVVVDTIEPEDLPATNTTFTDFSNVAVTSTARYAGNSAKGSSGEIMFRSKNTNSGIVSTTSGGTVKSVTIVVASGSNTIEIYGSNTAYNSAGDLYSEDTQGTLVGSLSATGTIDFTELADKYTYIGIRSSSGFVYITSIEIVWE